MATLASTLSLPYHFLGLLAGELILNVCMGLIPNRRSAGQLPLALIDKFA